MNWIWFFKSESRSVVYDSLWPHGPYSPWNSPGQNTGVGSLSLLQGIFPTQDGTQVSHIAGGFFTSWATRESPGILEWVAFPFSRGSSQPRDWTQVYRTAGGFFTHWATREALSCGYIITKQPHFEICVLTSAVSCYFRADHQDVCFSSQPKRSQDKPDFLSLTSRGCSFKNCPLNYVLKWVYSCQSHTIQILYGSVKCRTLHPIPRVLFKWIRWIHISEV